MGEQKEAARPTSYDKKVGLVLQGGGALGSYQAGVYEALSMDIVELIYRPTDPQGHSKDYEFSRTTMRARWAQGLSDARTTLLASPWLAPMPPEVGARTFDVLKDAPSRAAL
jgi:Patatin phospholipase